MEETLVKKIIEEKQGSVKSLRPVSGGATHHIFDVELDTGEEFIFQGVGSRWHDLPSFESGYRIEPFILEFLQKNDYLAPGLIDYNFSKEEYGVRYLFIEKIPGNDMNALSDEQRFLNLVEQSGELLEKLQSLASFKSPGKLYEYNSKLNVHSFDWPEMYKSLIHTYTTHMIDRKYDYARRDIENIVEENQNALESDEFTLVHQEFGPRNIISRQNSVTGIVDWERTISGDPKFDLINTRERMVQKARQLDIQKPREKVKSALYKGLSKRIFDDISQEKDDLYRLAYISQLMWVARDEDPEKLKLETQFNEIKARLNT